MRHVTLGQDPIRHINEFFQEKELPYTVEDVIRLKKMRVGGREISMQRQIDELGGVPSRSTLYLWHIHLKT